MLYIYIYILVNIPTIPTISWIATISNAGGGFGELGMNQWMMRCARDSEKTKRWCPEPMVATSVVASSGAQQSPAGFFSWLLRIEMAGPRSQLILKYTSSLLLLLIIINSNNTVTVIMHIECY